MKQVIVPKETQEQKQLIAWCEYQKNIYPELDLIFHIVNEGKRSKRTGAELKRMGMKKGVPDICLPVPKGKHHGLWIELKADKTKRATKEQKEWLVKLTKQGYKAVMCYGAEDAITVIKEYLNLKTE